MCQVLNFTLQEPFMNLLPGDYQENNEEWRKKLLSTYTHEGET